MAKYLEKLNCNLASKTPRTTENSWKCIVCIQVSNYPFDIWKFGALFSDNYNKLKGLNLFSATCLSSLSLILTIIFSSFKIYFNNW